GTNLLYQMIYVCNWTGPRCLSPCCGVTYNVPPEELAALQEGKHNEMAAGESKESTALIPKQQNIARSGSSGSLASSSGAAARTAKKSDDDAVYCDCSLCKC